MSKLSPATETRIAEQILAYLYQEYDEACSTHMVADEVVRSDHFVLRVLEKLKGKKLVSSQKGQKNALEWKLTALAHGAYKEKLKS